ncbi:ABC transporter ATP-binding protein [Mucilaginibacter auburnensis]|uniref:Putative ABC transport system ATP-binding protein n=1 Tax=Mucilaginibacter auburnensis TaxID=1457233 RepID=A0A2H9VLA3_9SPHI|nr:ATP-binding cassette domain-containing protein [Mucilaginibacter auburnensis]PJJ79106.1 putative ABC transport system ATP-binding protein [Mucilaginibacter auburnensis]
MQTAISLTNISKTFNYGKPTQVDAVKNVNLAIEDGEFVVIVGSNGSGKTTLLNLISGSIYPTAGTIKIYDTDVTNLADHERSRWIARVFQNPLSGTASELSILDNFRLAALRTKAKGFTIGIDQRFKNIVKDKVAGLGMGLENKIDQAMGTLSGGQRQALTLLMSVMDDCKVLLLDEPTAALDPRSADVVMKTANQLTHDFQLTTILVTHNLKDAFTYGNRIIQMAEGNIIKNHADEAKTKLTQNDLFDWFS